MIEVILKMLLLYLVEYVGLEVKKHTIHFSFWEQGLIFTNILS